MTQNQQEIKIKADEVVEMFEKINEFGNWFDRDSLKCAILMYEEIVKISESVDLYFKVDYYKSILTELKSRL